MNKVNAEIDLLKIKLKKLNFEEKIVSEWYLKVISKASIIRKQNERQFDDLVTLQKDNVFTKVI